MAAAGFLSHYMCGTLPYVKFKIYFHFLNVIVKHSRKEGNVLFNNALNTFYLLLYVIGHMVKDHGEK